MGVLSIEVQEKSKKALRFKNREDGSNYPDKSPVRNNVRKTFGRLGLERSGEIVSSSTFWTTKVMTK